jgi:hypothetical protein
MDLFLIRQSIRTKATLGFSRSGGPGVKPPQLL